MSDADDRTSGHEYAIPFTRLHLVGTELAYLAEAIQASRLAGDGRFGRRCERLIEELTGCRRALLTHSCTAALEMSAILAGVGPGDEVIMPSFTFVSTANAFVLRGATPVFVDIEAQTFNIDPEAASRAVTQRTRAIVPVHYGGVAADMKAVGEIAARAGAMVIEDAAQALLASHAGRPLGSFGSMAALSFHETKNVISGEGGALLLNDPALVERAEIVREKGTDRSRFYRGEVDRYTWTDLGSSYVTSELVAAFLLAQLERAREITTLRQQAWDRYHEALAPLEAQGKLVRAPLAQRGNAHLYAILLPSFDLRSRVIAALRDRGAYAAFHYVPLHDSPAGRRYGRTAGELHITNDIAARLLRLPLWPDLTPMQIAMVVETVEGALRR